MSLCLVVTFIVMLEHVGAHDKEEYKQKHAATYKP